MNVKYEVRTRRLTAVLEEVAGGGCPPDLAARVLARVRVVPKQRAGVSWLAAACMLFGIVVVVVTARWRALAGAAAATEDHAAAAPAPEWATQEPAATIVTTAMVREACGTVEAPPPGDGVSRLLALARGTSRTIVVAPGVRGESKAELEGLSFYEMVVHIADELGVGTAEFGSVVVVGLGPRVSPAKMRCTLPARSTVDVRLLPKRLHAVTGLSFVVADDVAGTVEIDVADVPVRALLDVVAAKLSLQVVGCGSVLAVRRAVAEAKAPRLVLNLQGRAIGDVFGLWARLGGRNFVIDPAVVGVVSVRTFGPAEPDLQAALAAAVGAEVIQLDHGIVQIVPRLPAPAAVTLTAERLTAHEIATTVGVPDGLVAIAESELRRVAVVVARAPAVDVLQALAVATGRRWLRRDKDYVVQ